MERVVLKIGGTEEHGIKIECVMDTPIRKVLIKFKRMQEHVRHVTDSIDGPIVERHIKMNGHGKPTKGRSKIRKTRFTRMSCKGDKTYSHTLHEKKKSSTG